MAGDHCILQVMVRSIAAIRHHFQTARGFGGGGVTGELGLLAFVSPWTTGRVT